MSEAMLDITDPFILDVPVMKIFLDDISRFFFNFDEKRESLKGIYSHDDSWHGRLVALLIQAITMVQYIYCKDVSVIIGDLNVII